MSHRDAAARQLENWQNKNGEKINSATNSAGIGIVNVDTSLTIGTHGLIPLRDWQFMEHLSHFHRERIPERVVHAKGAGAFGYFECTKELSQYTVSKVFERKGKRTPIAVRFSTVAGNLGSADTVRDPRGFAIKFYTEEGIWDLVGNNTPVFFMRDPVLFPMFIHSQKRNPVTNLRDWDAFWDYLTLMPMCVHQVMILFSDRGIPDGHRHQNGYGSHTFSLINSDRQITWCKFIYKTDQGIKNLDPATAQTIAGADPDYALRDLYNSIAEADDVKKKFPSWTFFIQVMTTEQAKKQKFNPFDVTKVWPHADFPLIQVGKLVLNRNPSNYFAEVEQLALSPNNLTPGIGDSPDRLLQGRLYSYQDAHRYRLGANYQQLPVNRPLNPTLIFTGLSSRGLLELLPDVSSTTTVDIFKGGVIFETTCLHSWRKVVPKITSPSTSPPLKMSAVVVDETSGSNSNRPRLDSPANFQRDGNMCIYNQGGAPNYHPNSFGGPNADPDASNWTPTPQLFKGVEDYHQEIYEEDNYSQPKVFWQRVLDDEAKLRLVDNLADSIRHAKKEIQDKAVEMFGNVSEDLGSRLKDKLAVAAQALQGRVVHF